MALMLRSDALNHCTSVCIASPSLSAPHELNHSWLVLSLKQVHAWACRTAFTALYSPWAAVVYSFLLQPPQRHRSGGAAFIQQLPGWHLVVVPLPFPKNAEMVASRFRELL